MFKDKFLVKLPLWWTLFFITKKWVYGCSWYLLGIPNSANDALIIWIKNLKSFNKDTNIVIWLFFSHWWPPLDFILLFFNCVVPKNIYLRLKKLASLRPIAYLSCIFLRIISLWRAPQSVLPWSNFFVNGAKSLCFQTSSSNLTTPLTYKKHPTLSWECDDWQNCQKWAGCFWVFFLKKLLEL